VQEQKKIVLEKDIPPPMPATGTGETKKKIKCKHFPNCNKPVEECPYIHPTESCKYFPACTNGEKCIYLHPEVECKFGSNCTRTNCAYKHPKGRMAMPGKIPGAMGQLG